MAPPIRMAAEHGTLYLLVGPVGAGKSTHAERWVLEHPALFLNADEWMVRLFGDDERPAEDRMAWYLERRTRVREQLWRVADATLRAGLDVVVEPGLVSRAERLAFYERAHEHRLVVRVLDASRDVRRERVMARNEEEGAQVVPPPFFELASDAWEPPDAEERALWKLEDW